MVAWMPCRLDDIGLGEILPGGLGGHVVAPVVTGEAGDFRLLHHDLGAGDHQRPDVDRQLREHGKRPAQQGVDRDRSEQGNGQAGRDRHPQDADIRLWRTAERNARPPSARRASLKPRRLPWSMSDTAAKALIPTPSA